MVEAVHELPEDHFNFVHRLSKSTQKIHAELAPVQKCLVENASGGSCCSHVSQVRTSRLTATTGRSHAGTKTKMQEELLKNVLQQSRCAHIFDSLVCAAVVAKGRTSSVALNRFCRIVISLLVASGRQFSPLSTISGLDLDVSNAIKMNRCRHLFISGDCCNMVSFL